MNSTIKKRCELKLSCLNTKMSNHYALKLIPFATTALPTIDKIGQTMNLSKTYVFDTGDISFYIVHEYARRFNYEMLDQNEIIAKDPNHLEPLEKAYYGDQYFFFEDKPY